MFDPDPDAPRKVGDVLDNARRATGKLVMTPLPPEGTLTFVAYAGGSGRRASTSCRRARPSGWS